MEVKPLTPEEEDRARSWLNGRGTVQIPELVASLFATLDAERALRVEAERQRDEARAAEAKWMGHADNAVHEGMAWKERADAAMLTGVRAGIEAAADWLEKSAGNPEHTAHACAVLDGAAVFVRAIDAEAIAKGVKP